MMIPLAEQLRPKVLAEVVGQEHLTGETGYLSRLVQGGHPVSILLYGPPGCGKTTIARLYAQAFSLPFLFLSAVFNSASELKKILKENQESPLFHRQTLLFVDEIHRFNRSQQDIFLPFVEDGSLILVGATTENPSFVLNNALLSRLRVLTLNTLDSSSLGKILDRYEAEKGALPLSEEGRKFLIASAQGDGRHLLNLLENLLQTPPSSWDVQSLAQLLQKKPALYDRHQDSHYHLISALHKSIRGSDPDAALYWFARMLEGGEDPLYLARRLIRIASEDIGLADPQALSIALNGYTTYHKLGSPEGELALAQVVVYLALSPKSTAVYKAFSAAKQLASETGNLNPPKHILNAATRWMEKEGYGKGYQYDPDTPFSFSGQDYFPEEIARPSFYHPEERGFEREMKKRLTYFNKLREHLHS